MEANEMYAQIYYMNVDLMEIIIIIKKNKKN